LPLVLLDGFHQRLMVFPSVEVDASRRTPAITGHEGWNMSWEKVTPSAPGESLGSSDAVAEKRPTYLQQTAFANAQLAVMLVAETISWMTEKESQWSKSRDSERSFAPKRVSHALRFMAFARLSGINYPLAKAIRIVRLVKFGFKGVYWQAVGYFVNGYGGFA
jgi:hypothetical protein